MKFQTLFFTSLGLKTSNPTSSAAEAILGQFKKPVKMTVDANYLKQSDHQPNNKTKNDFTKFHYIYNQVN